MKYSEVKQGRVFVIRLEDGDIVHESIETFAREKGINAAALIIVGGADKSSRLVVGPEDGRAANITPMELMLNNVHEISGSGTIFPDKDGNPILHMHISCGREDHSVTGCIRRGVKTWHILEVIIWELTESKARRIKDNTTGFDLLQPEG